MNRFASTCALAAPLLLAGTLSAHAGWERASDGRVPPGAVVAGQESNGEPLYICRGAYNGGVHSGKVRAAFGACNIGWGGKEVKVNPYTVLTEQRWVPASGGNVPDGALPGGKEANGERLYLCRASYNGGVHPGKVRAAFGGCNIGWGGGEHVVSSYEVLVR